MKSARRFGLVLFFFAISVSGLERPIDERESSETVSIEGTFHALYADDFDGRHSELFFHLVTDDGTRFVLVLPDSVLENHRTGERLRVTGRMREDGRVAVETLEHVRTAEPMSVTETTGYTTGPKKVLLIRFNFSDDTSQPYSDATSQNVLFGATGSVAAFYAEASYGVTTHTGNVTPWLTVASKKPTSCDPFTGSSQAGALAASAGYNPANYDFVVYVFPQLPCGWAGLGSVGGPGAWINQALSTYVVTHEVGHNYGLLHAHSLDCGATPIGPTCSRAEYGDPFDTMGGGLRQFNAYSKSYLSWLTGPSIVTHSSGTSNHALSPLEGTSGVRALQVPTSVGRTYWVEFRQALGFDAGLAANTNVTNGVLIRLGPSAVGGTDLLDMTPSTTPFSDAALDVGSTFTDSAAGVTIKAVSRFGNTINVSVDVIPVVPTANFWFAPFTPGVGQTVFFYDSSTETPTSWSWNFGDGKSSSQKNPTHVFASVGSYTVKLTVSNSAGTSAPLTKSVTVVAPPKPTVLSLTASPAPPQRFGTKMTWTAIGIGGIAPLQYRFRLYSPSSGWVTARDYSVSNTFAWTPTAAAVGTHDMAVWIRSAGSTAQYDALLQYGSFNVGGSVSISLLKASLPFPQRAGTSIVWTAHATGTPTPLQYRFRLYSAASGWVTVRDYSSSNKYTWTPKATDAGTHDMAVWVRAAGSAAPYDASRQYGSFKITP